MVNNFKFGKPYKGEYIFVNLNTDLLERNVHISQMMFQQLARERQRGREEALRRQEELQRSIQHQWEVQIRMAKEREEYNIRQHESIQIFEEQRDNELRRRFEELKRYRHGF